MFPINFNFPYRKKDGSVITMEKALDGAGADLDLIDLDDVAITTPAEGDTLVYDNTTKKWKNSDVVTDIVDTIEDIEDTMTENGAHNVVNNEVESKVQNTITFTAYDDNSFTANGTATGTSENYYIGGSGWQKNNLKIGKTYIISSGLTSDISGCVMWFVLGDSSGNVVAYKEVGVTEQSITVPSNTAQLMWYLTYTEGTVFNNALFKPMVRLASDPSTTYAPHAMTNRELTEGRIKYKDITLENPSADTAYGGMYEFDYRMNLSGHIVLSANIIDYSGLSKMVMLSAGSDDILRIFSATNGSIATSLDIRIAYI